MNEAKYNSKSGLIEGMVEYPAKGLAQSIINKIIWGKEKVHSSLEIKIESND